MTPRELGECRAARLDALHAHSEDPLGDAPRRAFSSTGSSRGWRRNEMAKRQKPEAESTLADQVAEFMGKSLGDLMNRRDALLKEVQGIDAQVAAVSKRVSKQLGKWVPYGAPAEGRPEKAAKAGKAGSKRQRRTFTPEQRAEVAERMKKYWAKRRKEAKE